ncbi:MAG: hypothetical protein HFE04_00095 [Bacilli bacterium]|nr:hypothetical protein [Bacilli bacterium]
MERIIKEQEKQLIYKDKLAKIERYIDVLEENDINMESQREYLKKILTEEESKKILYELGTLIENLKQYIDIINIIFDIEALNTQQYPAPKKQLIFNIIEILKENKDEVKIPKKILKKALNVIYQNIKSELENQLESETLNYIGANFYVEQINEIIKEDIQEIKTSTFVNNPEMLGVLDQEIEKNKENLLNKQLLITIIACRKKEKLKSRTILYMMNEALKLNKNMITINIKHEKSIEIIQIIKDILEKYKKAKQKIKVNIPALILTGTLLTGAALSVPTISNKTTYDITNATVEKEEFNSQEYLELRNRLYIMIILSSLIPTFPIHQLIKICVRLEMSRTTGKEFKKKMKLLEQEIEILKEKILENKEIANEYYFLLNSGILKKEINEIEYLYYSSITWDAIEKSEQKTIEELKATYKRIKSREQN